MVVLNIWSLALILAGFFSECNEKSSQNPYFIQIQYQWSLHSVWLYKKWCDFFSSQALSRFLTFQNKTQFLSLVFLELLKIWVLFLIKAFLIKQYVRTYLVCVWQNCLCYHDNYCYMAKMSFIRLHIYLLETFFFELVSVVYFPKIYFNFHFHC